jgi:hypothetical protein
MVPGNLSLVSIAALKLLDVLPDQQIKHPVTFRTAKTAVLNKILIGGLTCRTDHLMGFFLLLVLSDPQKARQQLSQRKLTVKDSRIRAKIHLLGTLGTEMMFCLDAINHLSILNIGLSDLTAFT